MNVFQRLPKLLGENQKNTVPKQIWMCPLDPRERPVLSINTELAHRLLKVLERLNQLRMIGSDLANSLPPSILIHRSGQQLSTVCSRIDQFEIDIKVQL